MDSKEDCFSESQFAETRRPLQEASNLPGFVYSSAEWFEAEMRGIFFREWNCVGRTEQVKKPGDYFTVDIGGELVSVIRNEKNGPVSYRFSYAGVASRKTSLLTNIELKVGDTIIVP